MWADDDVVVARIRADFTNVDSVDIVTRQASGEEIGRVSADIAVRPAATRDLECVLRGSPAKASTDPRSGDRYGADRWW